MNQLPLILINAIQVIGNFLGFIIIARVLMSWVKPGMEHQSAIGRVIYDVTEPLYRWARAFPHRIGMIDLTPIIAFLMIDLVSFVLIKILERLV